LARLVSKNGGNPTPPEIRDELLLGQVEEKGKLRRKVEDLAFVPRYEVRLAAGSGETVDEEALVGYVVFRRDWLLDHKLQPKNLSLVEVTGRSMEPTLSNGDSVLVDHSRRELYNGKVYALNVDDSLKGKRVRRAHGGWEAESDSPFTSHST
jgi:phage repressor protein C with HTH and peptisase S24 domain